MQNIELEISKMENKNNVIGDNNIENKRDLLSKNKDADEILSTDSDDILSFVRFRPPNSSLVTTLLSKFQKSLFLTPKLTLGRPKVGG